MPDVSLSLRLSFNNLEDKEDWIDALTAHLSQFNEVLPNEVAPKNLTIEIAHKTIFRIIRGWEMGLDLGVIRNGLFNLFQYHEVPVKVFDYYAVKSDNELILGLYPMQATNLFVDIKLPKNASLYAISALAKLQAEHLERLGETNEMVGISILDDTFDVATFEEYIKLHQTKITHRYNLR